jgi:hypothetical protein
MSYFRFLALLPLLFAIGPFLGTPVVWGQATPPAKPPAQPAPAPKPPAQTAPLGKPGAETKPAVPAAPAPPKADPKADATLKQLLDQLDPSKVGWVEAKVWQQTDGPGLSLNVDGSYLAGPGQLLRLDIRVHAGGVTGETKTISDGTTVWIQTQAGSKEEVLQKWDLHKIQEALNSPGTPPQLREEFNRSQGFTGLVPLLTNLRKEMTFTKQEPARWNGQEVQKLTAVWSPEMTRALGIAAGQWAPYLPRTLRLYVGKLPGNFLWPYRLEWWGPTAPKGEDRLLIQMEFRDPQVSKPDAKAPEGQAGAFRIETGKVEATDRTKEMLDQIAQARNRAASLPGASGPARP